MSLGYRVIEEYLRQGRQEAELHGLRNAAGSGAASFEALSGRLLRDGLDWLESLARLWRWLDPLAGAAPAAASGAAAAAAVAFRLRVACDAPAELRIELRPGAAGRSLGVQILRAPDPRVAAIDGVELAMDGTGGLCVALSVRPRQPPGLYSAIVFDRADGSVQGTLSLSIEPSGAAP